MPVGAPREADLAKIFAGCGDGRELVGIEVECGLVDPLTGKSAPVRGESGGEALLSKIAERLQIAAPANESHHLSVRLPDGGLISLEAGGAVEYSSAPGTTLSGVVEASRTILSLTAEIADSLGLALLPGGLLPFTQISEIPWIDKPRIQMLRNHFASLGEAGSLADEVMGLTLSTQVSLDYRSPDDLAKKLSVLVAASPILSALFVNSPIAEGLPSGVLSRRTQYWRRIDPQRCSFQDWALTTRSPIQEIVERMLELPMIYRRDHDRCRSDAPLETGTNRNFRELIDLGFEDGTSPDLEDWRLHLSQVWPQVRIREFLEMRAFDGPPWHAFAAVPAVWMGLIYNEDALRNSSALLQGFTAKELDETIKDVAVRGLNASLGKYRVHDLALELLDLARGGLAARVSAGLDSQEVMAYLAPVQEVADTGVTFAEVALERWTTEFDKRPDLWVDAFRIPSRR